MKYNLDNAKEAGDAVMYLNELIRDKKKVEVKAIQPRRSLQQNSYLHVLLGIVCISYGWTMDYSKAFYKHLPGNKEIFLSELKVGGHVIEVVRSSADLNKEEMTLSIDNLRSWSAKLGLNLPTAEDEDKLRYYENQIEQQLKHINMGDFS